MTARIAESSSRVRIYLLSQLAGGGLLHPMLSGPTAARRSRRQILRESPLHAAFLSCYNPQWEA